MLSTLSVLSCALIFLGASAQWRDSEYAAVVPFAGWDDAKPADVEFVDLSGGGQKDAMNPTVSANTLKRLETEATKIQQKKAPSTQALMAKNTAKAKETTAEDADSAAAAANARASASSSGAQVSSDAVKEMVKSGGNAVQEVKQAQKQEAPNVKVKPILSAKDENAAKVAAQKAKEEASDRSPPSVSKPGDKEKEAEGMKMATKAKIADDAAQKEESKTTAKLEKEKKKAERQEEPAQAEEAKQEVEAKKKELEKDMKKVEQDDKSVNDQPTAQKAKEEASDKSPPSASKPGDKEKEAEGMKM